MSVRRGLLHALRPARFARSVALVVVLVCGGSFSDAGAAGIRTTVRFEPSDVRLEESARGVEVSMRGLSEAGGTEAPSLPMSLHTFYVPEGFEVAEVRAVPRGEVRVAEGVHLSLRGRSAEPTRDEVTRAFPAGALEPGSLTHPARTAVSVGPAAMAGYRIHSVAVFPVRQESNGDLVLTRQLDLELELRPARTAATTLPRLRRTAAAETAYLGGLAALVENPADVPAPPRIGGESDPEASGPFVPRDIPSVEGSAVDLVIITPAAFEAAFQPLVDWKTKKGVPTVVRTVEWIEANYPYGQDVTERIRHFIRDAYSKWGTFLVLLGGDFEQVTPRLAWNRFFFNGAEIPTDQYFACLEGDWNADGDDKIGEGASLNETGDDADIGPEVFVGRAPVSNTTEVNTFVTKSMLYEKSPPSGYVEDHTIFAEVLFPVDWEYGDDPALITLDGKTLTEGLDAFVPVNWDRNKYYQSDNTQDRTMCLAALNAGHHLLTLMNHGDAFKFSVGNGLNPLIYVSDLESVTNGDRLSVMIATACNPNQFDLEACGEAFLNNPNGGGIVSIGPTRVDFPLSATNFHTEMYDLIFNHGVTRFGAMTQVGRVAFVPQSSTDSTPDRWTLLSKNLHGDPELRMWTQEPEALTVTHAANVPLGTTTISIDVTDSGASPVADVLVCVSDANGTYSRGLTDAAGNVVLPLTSSDTGTVDVVATKAEYLPEETSFTLDAIAGPHLAMTTFTIDDDGAGASSGNGDGIVDAGETIELVVDAFNGGGASADSASVTASVAPGTSATFDLTYGGAADPSAVFIGPDATNPASIPFTLDFANPLIDYNGASQMLFAADSASITPGIYVWQDREGWHVWTTSRETTIAAAGTITTDGSFREVLALDTESATDSAVISAGSDSLTFSMTVSTTDLTDQFDFSMSDGTVVTVTTPSDSYGNLGASGSGAGTVVFDVAATARREQIAYVDLSFTSTSGGPWSGVVPLVFAGPSLEAYQFTIDDSNNPPVSGDGDGVVEVGETVRLTPSVHNRGSGHAGGVNGAATAASGITFVDAADAYGDIDPLAIDAGTDGYVFTVDDGSGTSIDLTLTDDLGRTTVKNIEFVAPPVPTDLVFTSGPTVITLTWADADTAGTPDLAGYNVYRSATSGTGFTLQNFELLREATRYVDPGLSIGTTFYYQVSAVDSSGNESPLSPELQAWTTLAQVPGWPQLTGSAITYPGLLVGDADGISQKEVYVGTHGLLFYGWNHDGAPREGFPVSTNGQIWSTAAMWDVDKDGDEEIFWGANDSRFYGVHHDGSPVYGSTPHFVDLVGTGSLIRSCVTIADVDQDAEVEILFGTDAGTLHLFNHDGTGWADSTGLMFTVPGGGHREIWGSIAVADLDGDGEREICFGSWNDNLYVLHSDGNVVPGFPRTALPKGGQPDTDDFKNGPTVGDLDNDGTMELVICNLNGDIYAFDHDGGNYMGNPDGVFKALGTSVELRSNPVLANLDGDPELEIVVTAGNGKVYAWNHDGTGFTNPDGTLIDVGDGLKINASPIIVDVDGDMDYEVLFGSLNGKFYAYHLDGSLMVGFPIPTLEPIHATAAADDIDGDGDVDVAFSSYEGTVNVLDFQGAAHATAFEWPTFAGARYRTAVYGEPGPYQTGVDPVPGGSSLVFSLAQNVPNPFPGATSIRYVVPQDMKVSLRVYNVSGRLIRTLVNGPVSAGPSETVWDGRDTAGRRVSSGVYFYRLENGRDSITKKGVVLR